jgi:hypothetical protein
VVEPEVVQARRPSNTLEGERVSNLADGRCQMSADFASSFFSPSNTPSGVSAPASDLAVMAKSCGAKCCEALVGPVVTVSQAELLRMPGGGSKLG